MIFCHPEDLILPDKRLRQVSEPVKKIDAGVRKPLELQVIVPIEDMTKIAADLSRAEHEALDRLPDSVQTTLTIENLDYPATDVERHQIDARVGRWRRQQRIVERNALGGRTAFILARGIGKAFVDKEVDLADVAAQLGTDTVTLRGSLDRAQSQKIKAAVAEVVEAAPAPVVVPPRRVVIVRRGTDAEEVTLNN